MYQRSLCPSMGTVRRSLTHDVVRLTNGSAQAFHLSTRRYEENSASTPNTEPKRETRRTRQNEAVRKVGALQNARQVTYNQGARKPPSNKFGLAGGIFPSGQRVQDNAPGVQSGVATGASASRQGGFQIRKGAADGSASQRSSQPSEASPRKFVRAPANLRITRNAAGSGPRGPNLRGRSSKPDSRAPGRATESGPKRRERKAGAAKSSGPRQNMQDVKVQDTLSDGMVQHLLRLQRKEWDRVVYEPKYAHGSTAARELIDEGKRLFQGEVKVPATRTGGRLEKTIGIVGMHGAGV